MTTPAAEVHDRAGFPRDGANAQPARWSAVFAMSLCVFALIASEFMPVSLLTPIASDLGVTEGLAGQGIAISGVFAVLTSLSVSTLAGGMNRKTLLLGLTALMAVSGAVVAMAPNYLTYMLGRALIGVVIGGFWSLSAATAMRLVPSDRVPRALAIFNGGNALATVIAAPLGSYLGSLIGWRRAFSCLVPVAATALVWQWLSLPSLPAEARARGTGNVFRLFRSRTVALGMAACGAFFMGQFALFTYVRPFLETVTHVGVSTLSLILLVIGVAGFAGTALIGSVLQRGLYRTLIVIPILMALIAVALMLFGGRIAAVATLLGLWGLMATAAPAGWWSWIAEAMPPGCRSRRRPDGGGDSTGHCRGLYHRRHAVRFDGLSKHLHGQRDGAAARGLADLPDLAFARAACGPWRAQRVLKAIIMTRLVVHRSRQRHVAAARRLAGILRALRGPSLLVGLLVLGACQAGQSHPSRPPATVALASAAAEPKESRMWMTVGERRFAITLADNEAASAFAALLPLTLDMAELNGNEKHGELPRALPTNASRPGTIRNGDLMLYGSKTLVVFYLTFDSSYSYTRLGRVEDPAGLAPALGRRDVRIVFSKE